MTIQQLVENVPLRVGTMTVLLLLLTSHIALILSVIRQRRSRIRVLLWLLHAGISLFCAYWPVLLLIWEIRMGEENAPIPVFFAELGGLPAIVLAGYILLTVLLLGAGFWELRRYGGSHPGFDSIKEAMDLLPVGIAFGKAEGPAAFRNDAMNQISRALTGRGLGDLSLFRRAVSGSGEELAPNERTVELPEGSGTWLLTEETADVDGSAYIQITAANITREAAIAAELKQKNQKLREIQMRLKIYNRQAERIIIDQELLKARMSVHNQLGNMLLESRRYLLDSASIDENRLLQALRNTNRFLLKEFEADDSARDPLTDAMETADAIGVDVTITGRIPTRAPFRELLAAAIQECASNTVKHANGDSLSVRILEEEDCVRYMLQGNGAQPDKPVREAGGLQSLRLLTERSGGSLRLSAGPEYRVTLELPKDRTRSSEM